MMLSVMVVGAGAAFSDQSKIKNTEAVDACTALNIIGGYPDGSFKPEGNITRAEVTKMICVALNGGKEPNLATNATPTFSDVRTNANSAWAEKYIESCASQGIVSGVGAGKFAPAGNVTGTQLAKMLLVSLGYKSENEGFTGNAWATNVNTIASAKGLYEGLEKLDVSAALTRDSAARMIWNALQAYEVEYKTSLIAGPDGKLATQITVQDKVVGSTNDKITLLRDKYDAWLDVGTLVSVDNKEITIAMTEADAAASDYVISTTTDRVTTYSNVSFTKLDKDYSDLMGQKVKVIFKNGKTNDVLGVYATSDNVIYKTVANALEKDGNNKVKIDGKSYSVEYTRNKGTTTVVKTGTGLATYRDGEEVNSVDVADLDKMNTSADNVVLVDSDNNGKIDIVYFQTVNVAKVTYASSTQLVAGGTTYKYADDNIAKDLAKDDWVVITKDLYNDCNNIVLVKKVETTIAGTRDKTGYKQYRVDGTWYNTADNKALDAKAGNKASVVTYNGIIFFADKLSNSSTSADIAMLVDTGSFNQVKLAFFDGTSKTVTVDDDGIVPTAANKGTVYVYEINGDEYKLSALNKENLDNDDYTLVGTEAGGTYTVGTLKDSDGTAISGSSKVVNSVDSTAIADSAKVLLYSADKHSYKLITGKQLKTMKYAYVTGGTMTAKAALSEKVDGLTKVSLVAVTLNKAMPDDYQTNDNYAVVVSDSFKYNSDYVSFDVFTGTETVTVLQKKSGATYQKGNVIGYSSITEKKVGDETAKVIEDVTCYTEGQAAAGANVANQYRIGAIQGVNAKGDQITVNGQDTFKITSDTKVLFVNSDAENGKDDYAGVAGNTVSTSNEADEIADTGMYFYNCAYILDGGYTANGDSDLAVLVIDVKNRMANESEKAGFTVTAPTADTTNFTALKLTVNSKDITTSATVKKGDVIVVTGTAVTTGDGAKLTLTHAKFSDGTGSKDNIKGDFSYEIYADSEGTVSLTQAAGTHHA